MHTIESAVLVPIGLGLIVLLLMLTFYLHDQTVLAAEYSSTLLEWQMCQGPWDQEECSEETGLWSERLLITEVEVKRFSAGSTLYSVQAEETYQLFGSALRLLEQRFSETDELALKVFVKINPCWIKRIWKVVAEE